MFEVALPKIVEVLEEPVASPSTIPMYFLCERAKEDVKVVLMGQGPDELMAGYKRHLGAYYGTYIRSLPQPLPTAIKSFGKCFFHIDSVRRSINSLFEHDRIERYQNILSIMSRDTIHGLFKKSVLSQLVGGKMINCWEDLLPLITDTDELRGLQFFEVRSWLPDALLLYADKLSMAHGLEVRVPYLDQNIIEYVERLPSSYNVRRFIPKWIHKNVSRKLVPQKIVNRKKKAFAANVVNKWFLDSRNKIINDTLMIEDSLIYKYLSPQSVKLIVKHHQSGFRDNHKIIFSLAVLEEWLRSLKK
jgi:asparagine synthase (glutamine-hydrolysing)